MEQSKFDELFSTEPLPLQEKNEFYWLISKVEKLSPLKIIVEIGIDKGGTAKFWNELIDKNDMFSMVFGIDINNALQFKSDHLWVIFQDSTLPSTVQELKEMLNGRPIDFLFLDGCHEATVFKDYENYSPLVRKGGLIAFHDCGEPTIFYHKDKGATSTRWERGGAPDVVKCFEQIKAEKEVLQYDQGTGIVYV